MSIITNLKEHLSNPRNAVKFGLQILFGFAADVVTKAVINTNTQGYRNCGPVESAMTSIGAFGIGMMIGDKVSDSVCNTFDQVCTVYDSVKEQEKEKPYVRY